MKSCPTCNRTFEDTLTYCLVDGSILSAPFDPQATVIIPDARKTDLPPTEVLLKNSSLPSTMQASQIPLPDAGAKIGKFLGYISLFLAHVVLRCFALAFLVFLGLIGGMSGKSINWPNVIPVSILIVFGFLFSHYLIKAVKRAGISDFIGLWSYVAGGVLGILIYVTGLYTKWF
jgi:hypothetical protein